MPNLHIDLETYSEASLPSCGAAYYARHPSTRVLLLAYAYDDQPPEVIDIEHGETLPQTLTNHLTDARYLKWAHNAAFERNIIEAVLGIPCPPEQWRCTMVWARYLSLPPSLAELSAELALGGDAKDTDGKRLIRSFTVPGATQTLTDGEDWLRFRDYCRQDVIAEQAVHRRLSPYLMPDAEWATWALDQRINDTGLPVDTALVEAVRRVAEEHREATLDTAAALTGITNPNSRSQMLAWLAGHGVEVGDLQKATVERLLSESADLPPAVREALECRQQTARASISKYDALSRATCTDARLRGAFQFYGAGTGRWSGRIFQPQNLPRPSISAADIDTARRLIRQCDAATFALLYADPAGAMASLVRSTIAAPSGRLLAVADYASIESIMIAWCAQSEYLLDLYRDGLDPYKDFATKVYRIPYAEVTKQQRSVCKPAVLGAGYGLAAPGLVRYAEAFGLDMTPREAERQIRVFRESYRDIPRFWGDLDHATKMAMRQPGTTVTAGRFPITFDRRYLTVGLPSGRSLYYYHPRIVSDGRRESLTYAGRERGVRVSTHPGKIVENVVQAVARDLLAHGLHRAAEAGLEIVGHVHDEILTVVDSPDALATLISAMTDRPAWCLDAPIRAEGYTAPYYRKD